MSPAELMFARKIRSVFDKLLPGRKQKSYKNTKNPNKYFRPGDKVFLRMFKRGKGFWEDGVITKRVGKAMYMVRSAK